MSNPSKSINVTYSNQTEKLVQALAERLRQTGAFDSVFDEPTIVVPNWNLSRYLKFQLSQQFGVASDYFLTLEELLGMATEDHIDFLNEYTLQVAILSFLSDDDVLRTEELNDVYRYLDIDDEAGGNSQTAKNMKLYQLSKRLAQNVREYSHSRSGMLDAWRESSEFYTDSSNYQSNEQWQRYIWSSLFDERGRLQTDSEADESARYLLPEYFRHVDPSKLNLPDHIHIFGISHVAPVYGRIFEQLSRTANLHFYALNPCREFWEDVIYDEQEEILDDLHSRRDQARDADPESLSLDPDSSSDAPFALRAWGRSGRDLVHMLNTLSEYQFSGVWGDPLEHQENAHPTLLEQFQHDVLNFRTPESEQSSDRRDGDDSIRFLACRSKRREVEAIADEIWSLVMDNDSGEESISFKDIAVIVNPRKREEYQSRIETVFEQVHDIPFNEIDITRSDSSQLMDGIKTLLSLPTESIKRENILRVLTHPNFSAVADEINSDTVKQWIDRLGIFHGGDRTDHASTYIDRDVFNWDQGLRRLVLGYFMNEDKQADDRLRFQTDSGDYRPYSVSETDIDVAGNLIESVRRLIASVRSVQGEKRSLTEWFDWMVSFIRANFEPSEQAQEAEFNSYLDKLTSLADVKRAPDDVEYETALQFALDQLGSLESKPGDYLAGGVVVSSFVPQRPIPFDCVFIMGMTEEDFPASSPRSPIDLHTEQWQNGDLWDRDRERYMFFETLLSVRQSVFMSWVAEDPVTGEPIEPSSVLREFQQILRHYVGQDGLDDLVVRHHLRRFNPHYFNQDGGGESIDTENEDELGRPAKGPTFNPEAIDEAKIQQIRQETLQRENWVHTRELSTQRMDGRMNDLMRSVDWSISQEEPDDREEETPQELKIKALGKYFRSPLQAWASYAIGLSDEDHETLIDKNTEPFETDTLWGTVLPRNAFENAVLHDGQVPRMSAVTRNYQDEKLTLQEEGHAPTGLFGDVQESKHRDVLEHWLEQIADDAPQMLTRYRFGSSGKVDNVRTETPVQCELLNSDDEKHHVDLVGDTELFNPMTDTFYTVTTSIKPYKYLRGYLSGLLLMQRGVIEGDEFRLLMIGKDDVEERTFHWNLVDDPGTYLSERITELLTEPHDYRLPLDICEQFLEDGGAESNKSFEQRVRESDESNFGSNQDEYGPLDNVESYRSLEAQRDDADRIVEVAQRDRLKPFWSGYFQEAWGEVLHNDEQ